MENTKNENQKHENIYYNYFHIQFDLYKIEVGVLLDKDDREYECYRAYDKENAYYDENVSFEVDYKRAEYYAKKYVEQGVKGTYAIISKLNYDSEKIYGGNTDFEMDLVSNDLNCILGGHFIDDYVGMFNGELYDVDNIIFSYTKTKEDKLIENFIEKK